MNDEVEVRWIPWLEVLRGFSFGGLYYHESTDEEYANTGVDITIYLDIACFRFGLTKAIGIFEDEE